MVDEALVLRKMSELDRFLEQIGEYTSLDADAYRRDWKAQRIVERTLQMMIETCSDIAAHLIADRGFRTPDSYADTFRVLGEHAVLDERLASDMVLMAKFRNVVVHQYQEVDADIVVSILAGCLGDFGKFRDAVVAFLKNG